MAYKRASTLVGLPDQDRDWEDVQVRVEADGIAYLEVLNGRPPFTTSLTGENILQMVGETGNEMKSFAAAY